MNNILFEKLGMCKSEMKLVKLLTEAKSPIKTSGGT